MSVQRPYGSPQALRNAVTDRLRALASPKGRWTLAELQRQFAYDRLLARLYTVDDQWVLKGAVALLARQISVRHSTDIDVYRDAERSMVERELRAAAELGLRDWFQFEIGPAEILTSGTGGARYPVTARVGATVWASFHIDIVGTGVRMTDVPEDVPPVAPISVPGLDQPGYRAYPLVDHIADKMAAILEPHGDGRPSTRFRRTPWTRRSSSSPGSSIRFLPEPPTVTGTQSNRVGAEPRSRNRYYRDRPLRFVGFGCCISNAPNRLAAVLSASVVAWA